MKPLIFVSAICCLFLSAHASAVVQFKPSVLNISLLFQHDPVIGNVKNNLQWIRDGNGKIIYYTNVSYDKDGCFTSIKVINKLEDKSFHFENKGGVLSPIKDSETVGKVVNISGKVNNNCEITELNDDTGSYVLSYNVRGLLENMKDKNTGVLKERYEYGFGQFLVRYKNYKENIERQFKYLASSEQYLDFKTIFNFKGVSLWQKTSCSYANKGNADQCVIITASDPNYREGVMVWFTGHSTEYYK